jgi:hypothetical protein
VPHPLEKADNARLSARQSHRAELGYRASMEATRGPNEKFGQLSWILGSGKSLLLQISMIVPLPITEHASI